jgi:hypothetical protein
LDIIRINEENKIVKIKKLNDEKIEVRQGPFGSGHKLDALYDVVSSTKNSVFIYIKYTESFVVVKEDKIHCIKPSFCCGQRLQQLKICGPNIISVHETVPELKFHVIQDTTSDVKFFEIKINDDIADKLSFLKNSDHGIEHFRPIENKQWEFRRRITWSSHHQAILYLDFGKREGLKDIYTVYKLDLRADYQASESIFKVSVFKDDIGQMTSHFSFDLDKNYLQMEFSASWRPNTEISIWNLARPKDLSGRGKPDFEYDKDEDDKPIGPRWIVDAEATDVRALRHRIQFTRTP